jgi:phosphotransacetylase
LGRKRKGMKEEVVLIQVLKVRGVGTCMVEGKRKKEMLKGDVGTMAEA